MHRLDTPPFAFARPYRPQITRLLTDAFRRLMSGDSEGLYDLIGRFVRAARSDGVDAGRVAMALGEMVDEAAVGGTRYRDYRAMKDRVIRWSIDEFYGTRAASAGSATSVPRELRPEAR
jgi:hypothetical protein